MFKRLPPIRPALLAASVLFLAAALGGCAGGGGGPAGIPPPFSSGYPVLSNATSVNTGPGTSATYISESSNEFVPVSSSVVVAPITPGSGQITIEVTVSGVPLTGGPEPVFSFEVNTAILGPLNNSPLTGSTLSPQCGNCLTTGTVTADDGQIVTFVYLDPAEAGLTYSTLGLWSKPSDVSATTNIGGAFSLGVVTRGNDLPTSGSASYAGFFVGRYATSDTVTVGAPAPGIYAAGANATAQVNFGGAGSVDFQTLNTQIRLEGVGGALGAATAATHLNLSATGLPITGDSTTNSFTGAVTTAGGLNGTLNGAFYGRPVIDALPMAPPEMGGVLTVNNPGGTQTMVGGFALKLQ